MCALSTQGQTQFCSAQWGLPFKRKIHTTKLTGFYGFSWTFIGHSTSAFFCSLSEAQKGAEDKVQIKAQLGGKGCN